MRWCVNLHVLNFSLESFSDVGYLEVISKLSSSNACRLCQLLPSVNCPSSIKATLSIGCSVQLSSVLTVADKLGFYDVLKSSCNALVGEVHIKSTLPTDY
jgi:hypothetical protein